MSYFGLTDIGKRRITNQDCFRVFAAGDYFVAIVCDGMGGASGGSIASNTAADYFKDTLKSIVAESGCETEKKIDRAIEKAIHRANNEVLKRAIRDLSLSGMGTTFVGFLTNGVDFITVNIGDSRVYYIPDEDTCIDIRDIYIRKLTHDHSLVQTLIDSGEITEKEASIHPNRNIIMRALGVEEDVEADIIHHELCRGQILVCSDGLSGYFERDRSYLPIIKSSLETQEKVEALIAYANKNGGNDNITAILIEI